MIEFPLLSFRPELCTFRIDVSKCPLLLLRDILHEHAVQYGISHSSQPSFGGPCLRRFDCRHGSPRLRCGQGRPRGVSSPTLRRRRFQFSERTALLRRNSGSLTVVFMTMQRGSRFSTAQLRRSCSFASRRLPCLITV